MPTRDSRVGNGASYAAITSSLVGWTSERRTSCPATMSSVDAPHERLEAQPLVVRRARADAGVHDDEARDALGVLDREAEADRAAPVLHDDGHVAQVELRGQTRDRVGVAVVGVPLRAPCGLSERPKPK